MRRTPSEQPQRHERRQMAAGIREICVGWSFGLGLFLGLFLLFLPSRALAQAVGDLRMEPGPSLEKYQGRRLDAVEVRTLGELWEESVSLKSVKAGDEMTAELSRRAMRELDRTGRYADLRAELHEVGGRLILRVYVRPRRLIRQVRSQGGVLPEDEEKRALGLGQGDAVTDQELSRARKDLVTFYGESGYPKARVTVEPEETDDPREVLLRVSIQPGIAQPIANLSFGVNPSPHHPALKRVLNTYGLSQGERLDAVAIRDANDELKLALIEEGFYEANVSHQVNSGGKLRVLVQSGPHFSIRVEGNNELGAEELTAEMRLTEGEELRMDVLTQLLTQYYRQLGFLDVYVKVERFDDEAGLRSELYVWVQEGEPFRIAERMYPCLSGNRSASELDEEIEGVLSEKFPEVGIFTAPSASSVDAVTGTQSASPRPTPFENQPWRSFSVESHEAVVSHLRDLYRSEGYLDAEIGTVTVVRRRCGADSPPGECRLSGPSPLPIVDCSNRPEEAPKIEQTCVPDPDAGVRCEASGTLVVPVYAGRQAVLYDVEVEGNHEFSEAQVLSLLKLKLGKPLRRKELDEALRRLEERYEEEAYAFVQIDSEIELSSDHTRARLVLSITERQQVKVTRIDVRGATETREGLIRSRLALKVGEKYRRSFVVRSQEQLESLSVFTSVTIAMQDPGVPAREKVVVVTVNERLPQYLDIKGGFGTVDGFRIGFEYGHRNLAGEAIQLTLRTQLALRPPFLIPEEDVRIKYQELTDIERLERRNTITLAFPSIGLGPLFRFEVELLDLLANNRDFTQTRDAAVVRLLFRPRRQYAFQLGGTVELNNARILGGDSLLEYAQENPGQDILVPEGRSVAYTQNLSGSWDGRDKPLSATRGTYFGATVEHVRADPLGESEGQCNEDSTEVFEQVCSQLLRFSGKVSGYIPLSKKGMTLALSYRMGVIQHLTEDSRTYPDRLFFMGGADTLRGYPQFSLVPQDLADQVLDATDPLPIESVVLRGGDIFVNPRVEWRIPLSQAIATAIFLDTGNLWLDRSKFNPLVLRYTAGTGFRVQTPVGPLVFDYGFNLERVVDRISGRTTGRTWEDLGAFHFSIGLF